MKKKLTLTDDELIRAEFMRRFSTWNIPVDKLDVTLSALPNEHRQMHYRDLKDILAKDAFRREISDWKRRVSRTLSMGVTTTARNETRELTELEKQGLRQLMIEIELFVETLERRAMLAIPPKPLRAMGKKV
jgi:hypothetical protein